MQISIAAFKLLCTSVNFECKVQLQSTCCNCRICRDQIASPSSNCCVLVQITKYELQSENCTCHVRRVQTIVSKYELPSMNCEQFLCPPCLYCRVCRANITIAASEYELRVQIANCRELIAITAFADYELQLLRPSN